MTLLQGLKEEQDAKKLGIDYRFGSFVVFRDNPTSGIFRVTDFIKDPLSETPLLLAVIARSVNEGIIVTQERPVGLLRRATEADFANQKLAQFDPPLFMKRYPLAMPIAVGGGLLAIAIVGVFLLRSRVS